MRDKIKATPNPFRNPGKENMLIPMQLVYAGFDIDVSRQESTRMRAGTPLAPTEARVKTQVEGGESGRDNQQGDASRQAPNRMIANTPLAPTEAKVKAQASRVQAARGPLET